jgi:hypothetical protein
MSKIVRSLRGKAPELLGALLLRNGSGQHHEQGVAYSFNSRHSTRQLPPNLGTQSPNIIQTEPENRRFNFATLNFLSPSPLPRTAANRMR